jgi:hypothetical protein
MITPVMARLARGVAIAIALLAAIDPAITLDRVVRREVALVAADTIRDRDDLDRTARALADRFTVLRAPFPAAAATIVVGDALPSAAPAGPLFVVSTDTTRPHLRIAAVGAPPLAPLASRVRVPVRVRTHAISGRTLAVSLEVGGAVVDRIEHAIGSSGEVVDAALSFVPTAVGVSILRVAARAGGDADVADVMVDVRDTRWPVLFFDPRPSWLSTFVRRAVEGDERFSVVSRVVTSRNVSRDAGQPPASLTDVTDLERFDVVVVGAAQSLTEAQVAGLERFLQRQGGRVVLLFDERAAGPVDRLLGVRAWALSSESPATVATRGVGTDVREFRASEFAWPVPLPAGATAIAVARIGTAERPAIWTTPATGNGEGTGEIIVSGAHDSWRFRDDSAGAFDRVWRDVVANAAAGAAATLSVEVSPQIARPGEMIDVRVRSRDAAMAVAGGRSATTAVGANLVGASGVYPIRLWPTGRAGELAGRVRASPTAAGAIAATVGTTTRTVPLAWADTVRLPAADQRHLLQVVAVASGGSVVTADRLDELVSTVERALGASRRREPWHPMRSPWWIAPFALLLGAEWWWRRRSGLV